MLHTPCAPQTGTLSERNPTMQRHKLVLTIFTVILCFICIPVAAQETTTGPELELAEPSCALSEFQMPSQEITEMTCSANAECKYGTATCSHGSGPCNEEKQDCENFVRGWVDCGSGRLYCDPCPCGPDQVCNYQQCTNDPDCDNRCTPFWVCEDNSDCSQFGPFALCNPNDNLCVC